MATPYIGFSNYDLGALIISGNLAERSITINGTFIYPEDYSQKIRNHSPDGFSWGYTGSGCSQTALSILMEVVPVNIALMFYHDFKDEFVSRWRDNFTVEINLRNWLRKKIESIK